MSDGSSAFQTLRKRSVGSSTPAKVHQSKNENWFIGQEETDSLDYTIDIECDNFEHSAGQPSECKLDLGYFCVVAGKDSIPALRVEVQ